MTEFILHIGPPKTGTTAIQGYLSKHRDRLLAEGVDFPLFGRTEQGAQAHRHFSLYLRNPAKARVPADFPVRLRSGFTTAPLCILSSEGMYLGSSAKVAQRVSTALGRLKTIVFYRRAPRDLLVSLYKESLKGAHSAHSFQSYVDAQTQAMQSEDRLTFFHFDANLAFWAKHAAITDVTFGKDPDLVEGFFRACGLSALYQPDPDLAAHVNSALSDPVSWCLRMINQGMAEGDLSAAALKAARKRLTSPEGQAMAEGLNDQIQYGDVDIAPFLSEFHRKNPSFEMFRDDPRTHVRAAQACQFTLADLIGNLGLKQALKRQNAT